MPPARTRNGDARRQRARLVRPLAAILTLTWVAALVQALVTGDPRVLLIVTGPFTMLCTYVFTRISIPYD